MTDKNLTEIVFVLDRSGSMASCLTDTVGGFNTFIEEQKKDKEDCIMTLVQFDDQYEVNYEGTPIEQVPNLIAGENYTPRGMTALLDAVGKTINAVGERLAKTPEEKRPSKVLFVIQTDGAENASKEFEVSKVKSMIEHQKTKYSWEFVFLGADLESTRQAASIGISFNNSLNYNGNINAAVRGISVYASNFKAGGDYEGTMADLKQDLEQD